MLLGPVVLMVARTMSVVLCLGFARMSALKKGQAVAEVPEWAASPR